MVFVRGSAALHHSPLNQSTTPALFTPTDDIAACCFLDFADEFVDAEEEEKISGGRRGSEDSDMAGSATTQSTPSLGSSTDSETDSDDEGCESSGKKAFKRGSGALLDQLEAVMGQRSSKTRPISQSSVISTATTAVPNSPVLARTAFASPVFTSSKFSTPTSHGASATSAFPFDRPPRRPLSSTFSFTETDIREIDIEDVMSVFEDFDSNAADLATMLRLTTPCSTPKPQLQAPKPLPFIAPRAPLRRQSSINDLPYADLFPTTTTSPTFFGRKSSSVSLRQYSDPAITPLRHSNSFTNPFPSSARPSPSLPFPSTTTAPFSHKTRPSVSSTSSGGRSSYQGSITDSFRWSLSSNGSVSTSATDDSPPGSRRVSSSSTRSTNSNSLPSRRKNASEELNYEDFLHELASDNVLPEEEDETLETSFARKASLPASKRIRSGLSSIAIHA